MFEKIAHGSAVQAAVSLDTGPVDCAALTAVQHSPMNGGAIRCPGHQTVEDVQFPHEMALPHPANRRVAAHLANIVGTEGDKPDARTTARRGRRGFAPGVAGTYHKNVKHRRRLSASQRGEKPWDVSRETSLPETESTKKFVQHVFDADSACQTPERVCRSAQCVGGDDNIAATRALKRPHYICEGRCLATV